MAGIAIILDLVRKNPSWSGQALHSDGGLFCPSLAASTAAASAAAGFPFASRALFGFSGRSVAYCDAGSTLSDRDLTASIKDASGKNFLLDSLHCRTKEYIIEPKPLFSTFQLSSMALATLRSLLFYLPLLEPRTNPEEDDDDDDFTNHWILACYSHLPNCELG